MNEKYLGKILTSRVYDVAHETPIELAQNLSERLGNQVWLKREDQQPVFSFKNRGAYNKMAGLSKTALDRGVIASSAGNHAQGVALAGEKLGCRAMIVMPLSTPEIKIRAVRSRGAEVVLAGDVYDEAYTHARALARKQGLTFIPPYDDPAIIAGQGTIGFEILKQLRSDPDAIFVPVGGGGLIAGISVYVKQLKPKTRIIGVEPNDADSMHQALKAGKRVRLKTVGQFADGVAVSQAGAETFRIAQQYVDSVIRVSNDEMCAAIKDVFEDTRTVMEAAGALSIAGLKRYVSQKKPKDKNLVAIMSGANMNFDRLRHVSERAEIGERREAILGVTIPERPDSFRTFCETISNNTITEFNYRYSSSKQAEVFVGLTISDDRERAQLIARLRDSDYRTVDLSDNEMAKLHVRHMVGGRSPAANEVVYRIEFPNKPNALLEFLSRLGNHFNISMFHYRNHGADYSRVLIGLQVPPGDRKILNRTIRQLGYQATDETDNPVYRQFLAS